MTIQSCSVMAQYHDDVIKWTHFLRYRPFVRGIHRSSVDYPNKGQWRGALTLSLICAWTNGWANNRDTGDVRRYGAHNDINVMTVRQDTTYIFYILCIAYLISHPLGPSMGCFILSILETCVHFKMGQHCTSMYWDWTVLQPMPNLSTWVPPVNSYY